MSKKAKPLRVFMDSKTRQALQDLLIDDLSELNIVLSAEAQDCDVEIMAKEDPERITKAISEHRVPILPGENVIKNFDPVAEKGAAFTYDPSSTYSLLDALIRARENRRFPYDWRNILRAGREAITQK